MADTHDEAREKVWDLIRDIEVAMMVTRDESGNFRSRPMWAAKLEPEGVLWFFTRNQSPKSQELRADEQVLLTYADPGSQKYVSVHGTAEVIRDVAKQKVLWSPSMKTWFPDGAESAEVALIKVRCDGAEYWDVPSSTLVHAYGWLKAITTGERPHPGDNDKVALGRRAS